MATSIMRLGHCKALRHHIRCEAPHCRLHREFGLVVAASIARLGHCETPLRSPHRLGPPLVEICQKPRLCVATTGRTVKSLTWGHPSPRTWILPDLLHASPDLHCGSPCQTYSVSCFTKSLPWPASPDLHRGSPHRDLLYVPPH